VTEPLKLAVLGSPIGHSKSPRLQAAAYEVLGLDWTYGAFDVTEETLPGFIAAVDDGWRGLSLTMPLKRAILPLLDGVDPLVTLTGSANTVLVDGSSRRGFNTDVYGVWAALSATGHRSFGRATIIGAGATAASVLVALDQLGADEVTVLVRDASRASALVALGEQLGLDILVRPIGGEHESDVAVSTLPGGVEHDTVFAGAPLLLDVAYDPWPSALASRWNGQVVSGLEMLIHQAHAQVAIFVTGSPAGELPDTVLPAMRAAVA
jgi:shikimate dehydrogenase